MFLNLFSKKQKSPNYDQRRKNAEPDILLLHYTGMKSAQDALARLIDPEAKVSAHYMVDEDGGITALVDEEFRAWHAGVSYWGGREDINSFSIGVEIVNPGHEWGYRSFPDEQMEAVLNLCQGIISRHPIRHVLAHSDVAPERRADPGELFNWKYLAENGVGLWPDPTDDDVIEGKKISMRDYDAEKLFVKFGYNPLTPFDEVVKAFHRHYYPEAFHGGHEGEVCAQTIARLLSLIRQKNSKFEVE